MFQEFIYFIVIPVKSLELLKYSKIVKEETTIQLFDDSCFNHSHILYTHKSKKERQLIVRAFPQRSVKYLLKHRNTFFHFFIRSNKLPFSSIHVYYENIQHIEKADWGKAYVNIFC